MLRLLFRQRRRLLFGGFFGSMALMLMALDYGGREIIGVYPKWIALTALGLITLIVALGILFVSAAIMLFLGKWRRMIELFSLVFCVNATPSILFPSLYEIPYISGFVPLILIIAVFSLVYEEALDRFRLWVNYNAQRSFNSPKSSEDLWAELVPGEAPVDAH